MMIFLRTDVSFGTKNKLDIVRQVPFLIARRMVKARGKREGARKREEFCAVVIVFLKKNLHRSTRIVSTLVNNR